MFPKHPHGEFAACLQGSKVKLPAHTQRVDLAALTAGVEAFDSTTLALQEPDLNPGMEPLQAKVRASPPTSCPRRW
ncbi:hypothetical protein [Pseudomonas sp. NPDC087336]|uniref:hypothetical protein n=1 Tax=Pseudomonas sp. NPDC087336 TaxID=3364436 RepID=UPI00382B760A